MDEAVGQEAVPAGYPQMLAAVRQIGRLTAAEVAIEQAEITGYHPGRAAKVLVSGQEVGQVGELHPDIALENHLPRRVGIFEVNLDALFELSPKSVTANPISPMPAATQDISLVVNADLPAAKISRALLQGASDLLEDLRLVDDYRGAGIPEGKKSLTFALRFRASDRTLTQAEVTLERDQAVAKVASEFGAELRA